MIDSVFVQESIRARTMAMVEPERADYWHGYRRGLRRARFGEQFGTAAEHQLWLTWRMTPTHPAPHAAVATATRSRT